MLTKFKRLAYISHVHTHRFGHSAGAQWQPEKKGSCSQIVHILAGNPYLAISGKCHGGRFEGEWERAWVSELR